MRPPVQSAPNLSSPDKRFRTADYCTRPGDRGEEQLSADKQARFVRKAQVHQVHLRCELSLEKTGLSCGGGASK